MCEAVNGKIPTTNCFEHFYETDFLNFSRLIKNGTLMKISQF